MTVASIVPKATILSAASGIRNTTIIIVILACVVALLIGSMMAQGISREVTALNRQMDKVSAGDFTTEFTTKRNDEFKLLAGGMTEMLQNIRQLMQNVIGFIAAVSESTEGVAATASTWVDSMTRHQHRDGRGCAGRYQTGGRYRSGTAGNDEFLG